MLAEVKKTVITMIALPHDAAEGDHTVYIDRPDPMTGEITTFALCTLNKDRCPHVRTETMFIDSPVRMFHTGESVVSVTGYDTVEIMGYGEGDESESGDEEDSEDSEDEFDYGKALLGESDESDEESDDKESDDDEDDEDDEAPELVGLSIPSASEDDSILEADVEDSDLDMALGDVGGDSGESDDSSDSSSEDGEDDGPDDSSDSSDSDESDEESMEIASDSDDEEEREAMKRRLKNLSTPQPGGGKKQKVDHDAKVPASAPAKVSNPKVPTNEAEYGAALRAYIQQNGGKDGVPLSQLGNVKRPAAVSRLKKYLEANKDKFTLNKTTNTVTLA